MGLGRVWVWACVRSEEITYLKGPDVASDVGGELSEDACEYSTDAVAHLG